MDIKEIGNQKIDYILSKDKIILLEFYTSWCPTCKMVAMTLEDYEENHDDIFVLQINADENKDLANIYKVTTAPTLIFLYHGELKTIHHGFIEIEEIEEIVKEILHK